MGCGLDMLVVHSVADAKAARGQLRGRVGFVATMGALHSAHAALLSAIRTECDSVAVSIFVNPAQFDQQEDFAAYPRPQAADLALCRELGVDLVWAPTVEDVYPPGFQTFVEPGPLAHPLEGAARPGHFRGVATIVTKLLIVLRPDVTFFGQKDWQQTRVVDSLIGDLDLGIELKIHATIREQDGLALSSRNTSLTRNQRRAAVILYKALGEAARLFQGGERNAQRMRALMLSTISSEPLARPDYVSVADALTLEELEIAREPVVLSCAARLGEVRLIDNFVFGVELCGASRP